MAISDIFCRQYNFDQGASMHYANSSPCRAFEFKPLIKVVDQHEDFHWFDLFMLAINVKLIQHTQNSLGWLRNKMVNTHD